MSVVTDSISIFTKGWFNSSSSLPDIVDVGQFGWFESEEVSESWENYSELPNQYFQEEVSDYNSESVLFDSFITESINLNGVPTIYYVSSFNISYDKIFGEDNKRKITRQFTIQSYFELPNEDEVFSGWAIEGIDNFHMTVSIKHFQEASQYNAEGNRKVYSTYVPKSGDFVQSIFNGYHYEIVSVKQQIFQFHKRLHVYDLIVRPIRDENISVSATIPSNDNINNVENILDIFDIEETVENEKPLTKYDSSNDDPPPNQNLFGGW